MMTTQDPGNSTTRLQHALAIARQVLARLASALVLTGKSIAKAWKSLSVFASELEPSDEPLPNSVRYTAIARYSLVFIIFATCLASLISHIYNLQVTEHEKFEKFARQRCLKTKCTTGMRGCIFDKGNNLLAGNITTQDILAEPKRIPKKKLFETIAALSETLDIKPSEIATKFYKIANTDFDITLSDQVDPATALAIQALRNPLVTITQNPHKNLNKPGRPTFTVNVNLDNIKNLEYHMPTILEVAQKLGLSEKETAEIVKGKQGIARPRQIVVKRDVDYMTAVRLNERLEKIKAPGISVKKSSIRCYPQGRMLSNLIGVLDEHQQGATGIESLFESYLAPTHGHVTYLKDARGRRLPLEETVRELPAVNGYDVHLTICREIQSIAEEELAKVVEARNPKRAYAIMMEPSTGAILAMAQYPDFDPNDRTSITDPIAMQPHALVECFEPGSIMKGIALSYAISTGAVNLDTTFYCEQGAWRFAGRILHDTHSYEDLTILEIIKKSSNIGTAKAAIETGADKLYAGLAAFGFGKAPKLGFYPNGQQPVVFRKEATGIFRPLERWDSLSISRFPIGQGISCSPIQMLQAYAAIANNGVMMQPYIVDRIVDEHGVVTRSVPMVKGQPISPRAARQMTEALMEVTTKGGTATRAAIKGYKVAGKTGTAEIWAGKQYSTTDVVASFIGFAPAENPAFVLIVSINTPRPKAHGGTIAAPAFAKIAERTLKHLLIQPTEPIDQVASQNSPQFQRR
jgi:cell division protein FtsI/penicillin-binding protein 2